MHRLRGVASDVHEEHTPDGVIFEARLPAAEAGRYARFRLDAGDTRTSRTQTSTTWTADDERRRGRRRPGRGGRRR